MQFQHVYFGVDEREYSSFSAFYDNLQNKQKIFYMFFSSGLLHWVKKSLSFIPENVNIVLIGAGLRKDEQEWVRAHTTRPFHHIDKYYGDHTIWEMLFAANKESFGWIDIDCFVFNPQLFNQMSECNNQTSVNSVWACKDLNSGFEILRTYLLFINMDTVQELRKRNLYVSPSPYTYEDMLPLEFLNCNPRTLTSELIDQLSKNLPPDLNGRPSFINYGNLVPLPFFDTVVTYQLVALANGYCLNKVRTLDNHIVASEEIIHVGASSYYQLIGKDPVQRKAMEETYLTSLCMNYLLMDTSISDLPDEYSYRKRVIRSELNKVGISANDVINFIYGLGTKLDISRDVLGKIIG